MKIVAAPRSLKPARFSGSKLKILRVRSVVYKREALATALDVSVTTVRNWEVGATVPDANQVVELSKVLAVKIRELYVSY